MITGSKMASAAFTGDEVVKQLQALFQGEIICLYDDSFNAIFFAGFVSSEIA